VEVTTAANECEPVECELQAASRPAGERRHGFTMLEMIVVLAILAVLTGIAVRSLEPMNQQARVDATQKTLEEIRTSIVGTQSLSGDVTTSTASFVADVGRLPNSLEELFVNVNGLPGYQAGGLTGDDADVALPRGWRGPYMRLPIGATTLRDAWGNPFAFELSSGGLTIASLGSDFTLGGNDAYKQDRGFTLPSAGSVDSFYGESLGGQIYESVNGAWVAPTPGEGETVTVDVTFFAPDATIPPDADAVSQTIQTLTAPANRYCFTRPSIGPRVVKATLTRTGPGEPDGEGNATTLTSKKTANTSVIIRAGAIHAIDLRLQ
jgi:prepilin-type N-terminal cleavage/methylation domain-containing protein